MRRTLLLILALAVAGFTGTASAKTNLGGTGPVVSHGNVLTPDNGGPRLLYAPSESDDAGYRAQMAAQIGGTCDFFDARVATPSLSQLQGYDGVMTWANYLYFDNVGFGNTLADYVDGGGRVVLGAFCAYTSGNYLSGRIMTDTSRYCPVTGGFNHFSLAMWDGSDPGACVHWGITSYGSTYRDYLTLVSGYVYGRFTDREIANAVNAFGGDVVYANGAGGYPLAPFGQDAARAADGFTCGVIHGAPTHGACCLGNDCEVITEIGCLYQGGTYLGDNSTCDAGTCSPTAVQPTTWGELKMKLSR